MFRITLLIQQQVGLSLLVQWAAAPVGCSVSPPSVVLNCTAHSVAERALHSYAVSHCSSGRSLSPASFWIVLLIQRQVVLSLLLQWAVVPVWCSESPPSCSLFIGREGSAQCFLMYSFNHGSDAVSRKLPSGTAQVFPVALPPPHKF